MGGQPSRLAAADGTTVASGAYAGAAETTQGASLPLGAAMLAVWVATGLLAALVVHRRGHDFRPAVVLGFVLGPLFIALAVDAARHREREVAPVPLAPGSRSEGPVDVLVGIDGSADAMAVVSPVVRLLGPRIGRLTLAATIDYESAESDDWSDGKAAAALELEVSSIFLPDHEPSTVLLPGEPVRALTTHAADNGYDLLVVVAARRWRRLLRRRARRVDDRRAVPVLVVAGKGDGRA